MQRIYLNILQQHLAQYRQMAFLCGPRQVGKTSLSQACITPHQPYLYLNWDNLQQREIILSGIDKIYQTFNPDLLTEADQVPLIIFDEVHKYSQWKNMLKGYFDVIEKECKIIVTGSAKLNVYRRGGDSMMGRYFLYRIHPLSVAELAGRTDFTQEYGAPQPISTDTWDALLRFGGFPEPFFRAENAFYQKWQSLKQEQLFREDMRDLSKIHDLARIELLAHLLTDQVGSTVKYSELAQKVQVTQPTIKAWMTVLKNLYYCFSITPWSKNIRRSLLKEPKIYLSDWSMIENPGARLENLVACHLQKATHFWTDIGLGKYELFYLRDKDQHEADFLVTKNAKPWMLVEVKSSSNGRLSEGLQHFVEQISPPHIFQACNNLKYVEQDCFALQRPMIVPLQTLLSQLI